MKIATACRFIFILLIFIAFPASWSAEAGGEPLVFLEDGKHYEIDVLTGHVTVRDPEGYLSYRLSSPAAGDGQDENRFPAEIINFLLAGKITVSGLVWDDLDGSETPDTGEPGIADVRVFVDKDGNGLYTLGEPAAMTGPQGEYVIRRVEKGEHQVYVDTSTIPADYGFTTSNPQLLVRSLASEYIAVDFGLWEMSAMVSGTVWNDSDQNGAMNAAEQPITGVRIYLDQNGDGSYTLGEPTAVTDSSGRYSIGKLPRGTYSVRLDYGFLPSTYLVTPVAGTNPATVALAAGSTAEVSYGFLKKVTIRGSVRDANGNGWANVTVFIDLNGNGIYDPGEPLVQTNAFGYYTFDNLLPGTYAVMILPGQLGNYDILSAPGTATLGEGQSLTGDFLIKAQPATIAAYVWDDANANGRRDGGEDGLSAITVFLDANNNGTADPGERTTVTDATGAYAFTDVDPGATYIRADDSPLSSEYIPTTANPVFRRTAPGETYDGARFGFQHRLAPVNSLFYPTRLSWAADGNIYVSDYKTGSVFIYDSTLTLQGELKGLAKPLAVISDGAGNILVASKDSQDVAVYDAGGNLLRTIGGGSIITPNDLALDQDGNIYVLDSGNDTVLVFDPDGSFRSAIGNDLQIKYAVSIAINYRDDGTGTPVGELYVADQQNCTIHVYSLDGTYKQSLGSCGSLYTSNWDGKFSGLVAVQTDQHGNIHGLDNNLNVVQVFDPGSGAFLNSYNAYVTANQAGLNLQTDFSIDPASSQVVMSNVFTRNIELIYTVP